MRRVPATTKQRSVIVLHQLPHLLGLVEVNLERAGYAVRPVATEAELWSAIREEAPDMVVLDAAHPRMNVTALREKLAADPDLRSVQVVLVGSQSPSEKLPDRFHD